MKKVWMPLKFHLNNSNNNNPKEPQTYLKVSNNKKFPKDKVNNNTKQTEIKLIRKINHMVNNLVQICSPEVDIIWKDNPQVEQ